MATYTHEEVRLLLREIPVGSFAYVLGQAYVKRVAEHEWEIDGEPPRMLLTAIDRVMFFATPVPGLAPGVSPGLRDAQTHHHDDDGRWADDGGCWRHEDPAHRRNGNSPRKEKCS